MKSSELNHNDNPSASSLRDNPCFTTDPTIAALEVIADDGISYLLPYANSCPPKDYPTLHWKRSQMPRPKKC